MRGAIEWGLCDCALHGLAAHGLGSALAALHPHLSHAHFASVCVVGGWGRMHARWAMRIQRSDCSHTNR